MFKTKLSVCRDLVALVVAVVSLPGLAEGQSAESSLYDGERPVAAVASTEEMLILTYDVGDLILDVPDYPYPGSASATSLFSSSRGGFGGGGMSGTTQGMGGGMGMGGMGGGMGGMGGGFMQVRDVPGASGSGMGRMGGMSGPAPSASHSAKITMEDLRRVLVSVVAPDTWAEVGGPGELQHLGTSLVIRQSASVHGEIQDLLDQLREGSGKQKTVAIDARWLLLNSDELEELMPVKEDGQSRIDRKVLGEFTRRPSSIRGLTNCFTGQLVYLVSGTRRNVVTSFVPVVGSVERPQDSQYASLPGGARIFHTQMGQGSRAVGYQPVIATPNLGVLLQIRPTLIPGDDSAIVDLRSTLTGLGDPSTEAAVPVQTPQDLMVPTVDRVAIETQDLATTLSVPLGQPVLAGGLTYIGPSAAAARQEQEVATEQPETAAETPQLYLVLELQ